MTFTDRAKEYGLDDASFSTQAYFHDMDNDGDLDLFILNHPGKIGEAKKIVLTYNEQNALTAMTPSEREFVSNRFYENINGKFKDITKKAGLESYAFGLSAIVSDFNDDGFPDIYTANDYTQPDALFINNQNNTFTEKSDSYFDHFSYNSMGSDFADLDNDGFNDLIVVDMLPEENFRQKQFRQMMSYDQYAKLVKYGFKSQFVKNVLQWNQKGNGFSDVSYVTNTTYTDWSWAPMIADFDNNGHKDIYITNGYYRDFTDQDLMKYKGDSILSSIARTKTKEELYTLLSAYPTVKIPNYFFANLGNLSFQPNPPSTGLEIPSWSNGGAYADLDNDGDLEIVVNNINQNAFLFKNNAVEYKLGNFIRFELKSSKGEASAYGVKVEVKTSDSNSQFFTYYPTKGFMSCHEKFIHFGLGNSLKVDAIIYLKNGVKHEIKNLTANRTHQVNLDQITQNYIPKTSVNSTYFLDITKKLGINHWMKENEFIDYKLEPLLPHKFSRQGPALAVADINGDGREDFFIGGAAGEIGKLYTQDENGNFSERTSLVFQEHRKYEDVAAEFFDFDQDKDMDLLVVTGGNEFPSNSKMYPARLYQNNGKGEFILAPYSVFPEVYLSSKAIAISDYDHNGFPDLFIGSHIVPGHYGKNSQSYILRNEKGVFKLDTSIRFDNSGFFTDAKWIDYDEDGWEDLFIVGEWMPPIIYFNRGGILDKEFKVMFDNFGWWTSIHVADLDQDGKQDMILGNYGINSRYNGTKNAPNTLLVNDFDKNGSTDAIISYTQKGKSYPIPIRDNVLDQIPILKKRFNRYEKYSRATTQDLFDSTELKGSKLFKLNHMYSLVAMNKGKGSFRIQKLPKEAQLFPLNACNSSDIDGDGDLDLLLSGNDYNIEIESGRLDAGKGVVFENRGEGNFIPIYNSGYITLGDVKIVKPIQINRQKAYLVGKNNDYIQILLELKSVSNK